MWSCLRMMLGRAFSFIKMRAGPGLAGTRFKLFQNFDTCSENNGSFRFHSAPFFVKLEFANGS